MFKRIFFSPATVLAVILFNLVGFSPAVQAQPKSYNDRAYVAAVVDGIQATLPRTVDEHTVWTHLAYLPKNQVVLYRYRITSPVAGVAGFAQALDADVGSELCTRKATRDMMAAGLTVAAAYVDSTNAHVVTVIRTQGECFRTQL